MAASRFDLAHNLQAMFTKHTLSFLSILLLSVVFTSCKEEVVRGKGDIAKEQREVAEFDKVSIDMTVNALIEVGGDDFSVEVKAYENLQEHIITEVTGGKLRIFHQASLVNFDHVEVVIHMPALSDLEIHGAADADVKGRIESDVFKLNVFGASDVNIERIDVRQLDVKLSGASELHIDRGNVESAAYKVAGAGEIYADAVKTRMAKTRVSGAGEMELYVTDTLEAEITGAGEIDYKGDPHIISDIAGAGSLNKR